MISPIETFILVGVIQYAGLVTDTRKFIRESHCNEIKIIEEHSLENDPKIGHVYYVMCRRDDE